MNHKKRILLISYYFAPQNAIGAVRPTKLAKYLTRMGHEVTVVCGEGMTGEEDPTLERDMEEIKDIHVLREWNPLREWKTRKRSAAQAAPAQGAAASGSAASGAAQETPQRPSLAHRLADALYLYLWWRADVSFRRTAIRELRQLEGPYDIVFSSYAPFSVHEIARWAKQSGLARRWIADFRDEVNLSFRWQKGRKARYMRMLRRDADLLCAASDGFLEMMRFEESGRVLSNGFDREDVEGVSEKREKEDGALRVVYCGTLLEGRRNVGERDIRPMFRALRALVDERTLGLEQLRLVYAGGEGALFSRYAAECGLESCVENHGRVSREESIRLQHGADILLMASWNLASQKGILTGKLFEYMMMDKPIVCCMKGDLAQSGVKKVLEETGVGLCVEEANAEADEAALSKWLKELVKRWKAGQPLTPQRREDAVEAYAYPRLAVTLDGWMEELLEETHEKA